MKHPFIIRDLGELYKPLKVQAANAGKSMQEIILDALAKALKGKP